jgi:hypothetical protein
MFVAELCLCCPAGAGQVVRRPSQESSAAKAAHMMPFDLQPTQHRYGDFQDVNLLLNTVDNVAVGGMGTE